MGWNYLSICKHRQCSRWIYIIILYEFPIKIFLSGKPIFILKRTKNHYQGWQPSLILEFLACWLRSSLYFISDLGRHYCRQWVDFHALPSHHLNDITKRYHHQNREYISVKFQPNFSYIFKKLHFKRLHLKTRHISIPEGMNYGVLEGIVREHCREDICYGYAITNSPK